MAYSIPKNCLIKSLLHCLRYLRNGIYLLQIYLRKILLEEIILVLPILKSSLGKASWCKGFRYF